MEVLENNSHLKDAENQNCASNFGCRVPRDLNPGTAAIARSKPDTDIGRLVACKAQLSNEVIRWKSETLKLQKERDAARQKVKDLDSCVLKLAERAKDLETRLLLSEHEKMTLKTKSLIFDSGSAQFLNKISQNFDKYHSFPWVETSVKSQSFPNPNSFETGKNLTAPQEDWKEMSQRILEKMRQEMKELQELGNHFSAQEKDSSPTKEFENTKDVSDDEFEEAISCMLNDTASLKLHLIDQQQRLQHILNACSNLVLDEKHKLDDKNYKEVFSNDTNTACKSKPSAYFSRPSDESFRDYFTKQLGSHDVGKMTKAMQLFLQTEESHVLKHKTGNSEQKSSSCSTPKHSDNGSSGLENVVEEERICPICQATFSPIIPQKEFEEHVCEHLEAESASLLDQYVVL